MYPDDPRRRPGERRTVKEQILLVLMAVGIAAVVTGLAALLLHLEGMMRK